LRKYNPELLDKERVVAITKADMLDEELQQQMLEELPADFSVHFISSITGQGIEQLKNILWNVLNRS
jgi:GTP-binding protein